MKRFNHLGEPLLVPLELKSTINLPKTGFPMKANLPVNEPKNPGSLGAGKTLRPHPKSAQGLACLYSARWPPLHQRSHPPRHGDEQVPQGFHRQVENHVRVRRALTSRAGTATACPSKSRLTRNSVARSCKCTDRCPCATHAASTPRNSSTCSACNSSVSEFSAASTIPTLR